MGERKGGRRDGGGEKWIGKEREEREGAFREGKREGERVKMGGEGREGGDGRGGKWIEKNGRD